MPENPQVSSSAFKRPETESSRLSLKLYKLFLDCNSTATVTDGPVTLSDGPVTVVDGPATVIDGPVTVIDGPATVPKIVIISGSALQNGIFHYLLKYKT